MYQREDSDRAGPRLLRPRAGRSRPPRPAGSKADLANQIAMDTGFWLGDAFASGGRTGYDHKKMGITARGAWVSVRRHFSELGIDPDVDTFTCVGIGDMSGDVFWAASLSSSANSPSSPRRDRPLARYSGSTPRWSRAARFMSLPVGDDLPVGGRVDEDRARARRRLRQAGRERVHALPHRVALALDEDEVLTAINETGSLRMRANRIGLNLLRHDEAAQAQVVVDLREQNRILAHFAGIDHRCS